MVMFINIQGVPESFFNIHKLIDTQQLLSCITNITCVLFVSMLGQNLDQLSKLRRRVCKIKLT